MAKSSKCMQDREAKIILWLIRNKLPQRAEKAEGDFGWGFVGFDGCEAGAFKLFLSFHSMVILKIS